MIKLNFLIVLYLTTAVTMAQVGIGTDSPDPNVALDVAGDIIIRDLPNVSNNAKGLRPLFINPDGKMATSQTSGRLAIYESFSESPGGGAINLSWNANDGINGTTINSDAVILQNFAFTSTLNAKVMRIGLSKPFISNIVAINLSQYNIMFYDLKIEVLEGIDVVASRTFREYIQAHFNTPLNSGQFSFFYFPFEKPAGNYTIRLTSLNREREVYPSVDGTVRTMNFLVEKRALFVELYTDL